MAQPVGGHRWLTVGKLIELFVAMGCELHELSGKLHGPMGSHRVRFLYNPEADDFVSLSDLADDERIPPSEVESWERRLQLEIPKNWD
jgi:hypothetical protein